MEYRSSPQVARTAKNVESTQRSCYQRWGAACPSSLPVMGNRLYSAAGQFTRRHGFKLKETGHDGLLVRWLPRNGPYRESTAFSMLWRSDRKKLSVLVGEL